MKRNKTARKGFTLIELLVVIAIIAILSVVVILTLNPAELLRQSRDSNRISDLSVTKSAIAFYLASVTTPSLGSSTVTCYLSAVNAIGSTTCALAGVFPTALTYVASATSRTVDGNGWIPINFNAITAGGSPLAQLPSDPSNTTGTSAWLAYAYAPSSTGLVFKLAARMESSKYGLSGSNDVVSTDGGTSSTIYEQGTNLSL